MDYGFYITHEIPEHDLAPVVVGWAATENLARRFITALSTEDQKRMKVTPV